MESNTPLTRLALPKGRMQDSVFTLLGDAGFDLAAGQRSYRLQNALPGFEVKILKPQNILEMLQAGRRDVGFAGADWVEELGVDVVEVLDLELDPVSIVAAAPAQSWQAKLQSGEPLVIASEYERLTARWMEGQKWNAQFVRSFGATEVFPPEDADCIVDNTATGSTLRANGLTVVAEILTSTTRLYASPAAMEHPLHRRRIEDLAMLLKSVLTARSRVMIEMNVGPDALQKVIDVLPCMREPTVATLYGQSGFAVKAAVPSKGLTSLIPLLKANGAEDLVVMELGQIVV
ncbi:MAG: ATP phosphoribosyltransferase [Planctomycetes bacterium]|nr:ATP phosphoribosyltransferase [Planctomycetota bacterium]